jgi:hypothetical protein
MIILDISFRRVKVFWLELEQRAVSVGGMVSRERGNFLE